MSLLNRVLERTQLHWVRCLILAIVGIAVRFPALSGELIWDDASLVRDNPLIKSPLLLLETFRHYLALDGSSTHYRPLQNVSYFLDYLIWNADPFGYHLTNLLWHVGAGVLLYFLLLHFFVAIRDRFPENPNLLSSAAFIVALFWMVHPVHSAAVDYISGRADSLCFFFACAGWLVYLKAHSVVSRGGRYGLRAASALLALMSLCSRETGCVWLLLFLFHLFVFDRQSSRPFKLRVAGVSLCLLAIYAGLRQLPSEHLIAAPGHPAPFSERAGLMLRALGDYGRLMIYPANLRIERSVRWSTENSSAFLTVLGLATAAALVCGALRKGKARSIRVLGVAWFILAYLPVSNLFLLNATVAEHWLYLPSVGLLIFVAGFALEWPERRSNLLALVGSMALLALCARSFVRSGDWLNPETFYRHSLAAGAAKTRIVLNLAQTYAAKKEYAKAEGLLRALVASKPSYTMAENALGHLLLQEGKTDEAERIFARAANTTTAAKAEEPRTWIAALNLAYMKYAGHDVSAALTILEKARADFPGTWRLIALESEVLSASGRTEQALALVEQFREANWWHCAAAIESGRIQAKAHDFAKAEAVLVRASWLDIHDAESLNLLAAINLQQNRLELACEFQRRAVRRQPDQPKQYLLLADILERLARHDEAQAARAHFHSLRELAKSDSNLAAAN
jgi:Flp pilus assembly protein TadD